MKLIAFSVFDSKSEVFSPPICFGTKGMATRWFSDMANGQNKAIADHPSDFTLFQVGEFNDGTGTFVTLPAALNLGLATTFVKNGALEVVK